MKQKYWVPAIERASLILDLVSEHPQELRLIDLSKQLEVNKSSMYSLLNTLEHLNLLSKDKEDTYMLGPGIAKWSSSYFRQFDIVEAFYREAPDSFNKVQEAMQLGILEGGDVLYLGKMQSESRVQLITNPGMKFPAYASSLGKAQLLNYSKEELLMLYPRYNLEPKTPYTLSTVDMLYENLQTAQDQRYITEAEESALDFYCVGAPVMNHNRKIIAGISFTMLKSSWATKREEATTEIVQLARRLSQQAGYADKI
ncbi:IclR family KDG regulon transcriptional repressor [Geomicrobium halophilum]|uniref:IclR family KDG regulon transcriptional repressor n=1 Tax=Geomicrobium halophilum TaxID=549000 RepID=A0A841PIF1_9BACL|nr:IclR family transcriptional regulator [Geomicrobium halophilum]MBB6448657.1 IclR family KDG regulon transcriptional repressor [Geomicrobium halophilum]